MYARNFALKKLKVRMLEINISFCKYQFSEKKSTFLFVKTNYQDNSGVFQNAQYERKTRYKMKRTFPGNYRVFRRFPLKTALLIFVTAYTG